MLAANSCICRSLAKCDYGPEHVRSIPCIVQIYTREAHLLRIPSGQFNERRTFYFEHYIECKYLHLSHTSVRKHAHTLTSVGPFPCHTAQTHAVHSPVWCAREMCQLCYVRFMNEICKECERASTRSHTHTHTRATRHRIAVERIWTQIYLPRNESKWKRESTIVVTDRRIDGTLFVRHAQCSTERILYTKLMSATDAVTIYLRQ